MSFSLVRYSVVELHESPLFWLCIFLIGGACFCFDLAFELLRFTYEKTGSDFIREFISAKKINKDYNLNKQIHVTDQDIIKIREFIEPIRIKYANIEKLQDEKLNNEREKVLKKLRDQ